MKARTILPAFPASVALFEAHAERGDDIEILNFNVIVALTSAERTDLIADYHAAIDEVYRRHKRNRHSSGF